MKTLKSILIKILLQSIFRIQLLGTSKINCTWIYEEHGRESTAKHLKNHTIVNGYDKPEGEAIPDEVFYTGIIDAIIKTSKTISKLRSNSKIWVRKFPYYESGFEMSDQKSYEIIVCRILTE